MKKSSIYTIIMIGLGDLWFNSYFEVLNYSRVASTNFLTDTFLKR